MKFKCLISGSIIDVIYPVDIEAMLSHPQYEKVEEVEVKVEDKPKAKGK